MLLKIAILSIFAGIFMNQSLWALDLPTAVADSISAHPEVKEKIHLYRQMVADQKFAQSGFRPSIDLDASTGMYNTDSPTTSNPSENYNSSRIELSATQNLFNGYDSTHQIEQTKQRARAALFDVYDTADNVALDAIQAYLEVMKQQRLYVLATQNVNSHEGILSQIKERNGSGVGRRSQLQQTEGRVARAHASLIAQQNNLQDAATLFHQILGRYIDPESLKEPELPVLPVGELNHLIDQALLDHPAMKVAERNIDASLENYKRSRKTRYPNLDLRLASEWGEDIGGVSGNSEELSLVLNLTYNFYNGHADQADQQKKISIVHEQKEFSARVRRQIINTLRLAWVADESLTRQLTFLQQHVFKSQETVTSYREEFFIGQRDLVDLLDAESELNGAKIQHAEASFDAMAARYRIYEGVGQLFEALALETTLTEDDFQITHLAALAVDELPLPEDEDKDAELDKTDHCDNTKQISMVNDFGCQFNTGMVNMGYVHVNSPPVVNDDVFSVDANNVIVISKSQLLGNDSDADGDILSVVDIGKPEHGSLALDSNQNLIYRPNEGFSGTDSFSYAVSDGQGAVSKAIVSVNVIKVHSIDLTKMHYVNFIYKKTELTDISKDKILQIIDRLKTADKIDIFISAHTDSIASNKYNMELSERRAEALKEFLIKSGIPAESITAVGKGEEEPMADNATKSGQAINRRGEFSFRAQGLSE